MNIGDVYLSKVVSSKYHEIMFTVTNIKLYCYEVKFHHNYKAITYIDYNSFMDRNKILATKLARILYGNEST